MSYSAVSGYLRDFVGRLLLGYVVMPERATSQPKFHVIAFGCCETDVREGGSRYDVYRLIEALGSQVIALDFGVYLFRAVKGLAAIREVENLLVRKEADFFSAEIAGSLIGHAWNGETCARLAEWGVDFRNLGRVTG